MTGLPIPQLIKIPAGRFVMGSPDGEAGRLAVEGPQHEVNIPAAFEMSRCTVTLDEYAAFIAATGHDAGASCQRWDGACWREEPGSFRDPGFEQQGCSPAVCVSWHDANAYVQWLSEQTGRAFRLPTEAEWEYAARAGTTSRYWWGHGISPAQACFDIAKLTANGTALRHALPPPGTRPVMSYAANPWGLYQMHGNIWEWAADAYAPDYVGAPDDGSPRQGPEAGLRALRGGGWNNGPNGLRSARRHGAVPNFRRSDTGFRIARSI